MTIEEQVNDGIKNAMKAHDKVRLETMRNIKKVILEAKTRPGANDRIDEVAVLEEFLPKQLDEAELTEALKAIIAEVGASSAKDMGKVMGTATKKLAGLADGKAISAKVKELLG